MKRFLVIAAFAIVLGSSVFLKRANAFLGFGDIVFDPSNYAEAVRQLMQMQQQYAQMVQTYQMVRNQYEHMRSMSKQVPVNMAVRYRAAVTPWKTPSATNTYGTAGGWIHGVNTGTDVVAGYNRAVQALGDYGPALGNIPSDQLGRVKTSYATVELTDGANLAAIETIGRLRGNAPLVEAAIRGLEEDSLSSDPNMNTEVAVLNKINAANLIAIRTAQDSNKVLVALAEAQIIDAKRKRDAEAQAINNHIRFMAEGKAVMTAQARDASEAMRAWRLP